MKPKKKLTLLGDWDIHIVRREAVAWLDGGLAFRAVMVTVLGKYVLLLRHSIGRVALLAGVFRLGGVILY